MAAEFCIILSIKCQHFLILHLLFLLLKICDKGRAFLMGTISILLKAFFFFFWMCRHTLSIECSTNSKLLNRRIKNKTLWIRTLQTWHSTLFAFAEYYIRLKFSTDKMIYGKSHLDMSLSAHLNYIGNSVIFLSIW